MSAYGTMLLRVTLGVIYLVQAYLALFASTPGGTASFIATKAGLPTPTLLALLVIAVHGVGGGMLILGAWTRLAAAANAVIMLGGIVTVFLRQGLVIKSALVDVAAGRATPPGYEYVLLLVVATLAVASIGPGAWSLSR